MDSGLSIITIFLASYVLIQYTSALSCLPCDPDLKCSVLPNNTSCFPARTPCSCCDQCAGSLGDECGPFKVRCHPDFVCVNEKGEEKEVVAWHERFKGICKHPKSKERCDLLKTLLLLEERRCSEKRIERLRTRFQNKCRRGKIFWSLKVKKQRRRCNWLRIILRRLNKKCVKNRIEELKQKLSDECKM